MIIEEVKFNEENPYFEGAIINNDFPGFREDYLCLHALLKIHNPKTVWETGTNTGVGTKIIKNSVPNANIYSLDLPIEFSDAKERTGKNCNLPFTQLFGDSLNFDYSKYPCEAYFIDGAHTFKHVLHETTEILKLMPDLIVYHDADIKEVFDGLREGFKNSFEGPNYILTRVLGTRILYASRK